MPYFDRIDIAMLIKQAHQSNVIFVTIRLLAFESSFNVIS